MLFGRGQWALFGLDKETLSKFQTNLVDEKTMFGVSQLAASVATKYQNVPSMGINPFLTPRLDEGLTDAQLIAELAEYLQASAEVKAMIGTPPYVAASRFFGFDEDCYLLSENQYGFWVVFNEFEDVNDVASKQEGIAYANQDKPYKFLNKEEKQQVEEILKPTAVLTRKQFPVLMDFREGLVYVANTSPDTLLAVQVLLTDLGIKVTNLLWNFQSPDWPTKFLNKVFSTTKFSAELASRAQEKERFTAKEIEKLEDKVMERVVSTFFACSELESGQWAALTKPAKIKLFDCSTPVGCQDPSDAYTLLTKFDHGAVVAATVVFQELDSVFNKKGEEKQRRTDLFTVAISENMNNLDAGVALLPGFDIPGFKKSIKSQGKNGQIGVKEYWASWLSDMAMSVRYFIDNVCLTLGLQKDDCGLKPLLVEVKEETVSI